MMDMANAARKNQEMIDCFRDIEKWLRDGSVLPIVKPNPSSEQLRDQANKHYRGRLFAEAIECYTELLSRPIDTEQRSVVLSNRAQCFLLQGEYSKCIDDASQSIEIQPSDKALFRRAQGFTGLGRYEEAERDLTACRNITDKSDLNTRQRVDEKLDEVRRKRHARKDRIRSNARFRLCTRPPEWTLTLCESEFRDVVVDGDETKTGAKTVSFPCEMKLPQPPYVPRSVRLSSLAHVY
jgi:tetratricopeptide (TPR) repeat protein